MDPTTFKFQQILQDEINKKAKNNRSFIKAKNKLQGQLISTPAQLRKQFASSAIRNPLDREAVVSSRLGNLASRLGTVTDLLGQRGQRFQDIMNTAVGQFASERAASGGGGGGGGLLEQLMQQADQQRKKADELEIEIPNSGTTSTGSTSALPGQGISSAGANINRALTGPTARKVTRALNLDFFVNPQRYLQRRQQGFQNTTQSLGNRFKSLFGR